MNRRDFLISSTGLLLMPSVTGGQAVVVPASGDVAFADFESGTYDGWTLTGNCWTPEPASDATFAGKITGFQGKYFLCTLHPKLGSAATGKATSKEFAIEKPFITFLIGGGNLPGETCMNLVVEGKVVKTATGNNLRTMEFASWQVRSLIGKRAHLEVVDTATASNLSYIMVDDIRFAMAGKTSVYDEVDFNKQYAHAKLNPSFQQAVQQTVQDIVAKNHIVGATVTCVVDGKLVAAVAVGERKIGSGVPIEVTDPMHIASNTKGMTALVFARLVEKGLLDWKQTVGKVLGSDQAGYYQDVRLIDLLLQRSGMSDKSAPNQFDQKYLSVASNDYMHKGIPTIEQRQRARRLYVADVIKCPPGYTPGSKFEYCGNNYVVAGYIEEQVSGIPWEKLMEQEVFAPLHMRKAGFGPMGSKDDISAPWQHNLIAGKFVPVWGDNPLFPGPAGAVHCSALDLTNYAYARVLGSYGKANYLAPSTWRILQNPPEGSSYACGIATSGPGPHGVRDMSHGGTNTASCSDWWVRHEGRLIVVSMINCYSPEGNKAVLDALQALSEQWFALK